MFCFVSLVSCLSSWFVVSGWLVGLLGLKFLFENFVKFCPRFSVGWLGWLGCWFFKLVVSSVSFFLVGLLFRVGWLGWLGLKFLFENFHIFASGFQLVGWVVWVVGFLSL